MLKQESLPSEAGNCVTPEMIVRDLKSRDVKTQLEAVRTAHAIICTEDPPITLMVQAGIIAPLVDALDRDDWPDFQCRALDVLRSVAFKSLDHTAAVMNSGVISKLITFLARKGDLAKQAIVALGNFSLCGVEARDAILALGAVQAMLPVMHKDTPIWQLKTIMRTFSSLCSHETKLEHVLPALPYICELLDIIDEEPTDDDDDDEEKSHNIEDCLEPTDFKEEQSIDDNDYEESTDTADNSFYHVEDYEEHINYKSHDIKDREELTDLEDEEYIINKYSGPQWQVKHKPHIASDVVEGACTAITNIIHFGDETIEAAQAVPGLTARLMTLLEHEATKVKEAALNAVGNMLGGNDVQVDRCLDANCLEPIVSLLQSSNASLVQEAARATSNILAGTHCHIQRALDKDILTPLHDILGHEDHRCREQAAMAITCLCINGSADQQALVEARGLLEPYCALLATPEHALAGCVLDGLYDLMQAAERDGNVKLLCYKLDEFDVLDQLKQLQEHVIDESIRRKLADMSVTLRKHAREERSVVHDDEVFTSEKIVRGLQSLHQATQTRAARAAYYMLRGQHAPIHALLDAGIMAPLVEGLDKDACSDFLYVAAWAISNITTGTNKHRMAVINSGAIPKLLALLAHGDKVAELAALTLGNLAAHGPETRDAVLDCTSSKTGLKKCESYVRFFAHLCSQARHGPIEKLELILQMLPFVSVLLDIKNEEILKAVCLTCQDLLDYTREHAMAAAPRLAPWLVALLGHQAVRVQELALVAVAVMLAETDSQADRCLDAGCLDHVISLMRCSEPRLVQLAATAAARILKLTPSQIQQALNKDILTPLLNIIADPAQGCHMAAVLAITNLITCSSAEQRTRIVSRDVLTPYCALLAIPYPPLVDNVLTGLFSLLMKDEKCDEVKLCVTLEKLGVLDLLQIWQKQQTFKAIRFKATKVSVTLRQQVRGENIVFVDGEVFTVAKIVQDLKSQELATQTRAAHTAIQMLQSKTNPDLLKQKYNLRTIMIQAGIIAPLVAALDEDKNENCNELQQVVILFLDLFQHGTHKHRVAVVNSGVIPKLVALLARGDELARLAAGALGSMHRKAPVSRDLVLAHGAVRALLPHMRPDTPVVLLRQCVKAYQSFCHTVTSTSTSQLLLPALPFVYELLYSEDHDVLTSSCAAISNLVFTEEHVQVVQGVHGLTARLVVLLNHEAFNVRNAALSAVGCMLGGTQAEVDCCVDAGCLDPIIAMLQCSNPSLVKVASAAACNILRYLSTVQQALEKNILIPLLNLVADSEPNSFIQYHAVNSISNLTSSGTRKQMMDVIAAGGIIKLVAILSHGAAVAEPAITSLGNIAAIGPEAADLILAHGAIPALLPYMLPDTPVELLRRSTQTYLIICRFTSKIKLTLLALPYICNVLKIKDELVLEIACKILSIQTTPRFDVDSAHDRIEAVQTVPRLTARLVALLECETTPSAVKMAALMTFGNMLRGTEIQIHRCFEVGCLKYFVSLIQCKAFPSKPATVNHAQFITQQSLEKKRKTTAEINSSFQPYVVAVFCNIALAGSSEHRRAIVNSGAIPKLVTLLSNGGKIAEAVVTILGKVAMEGPSTRDSVLAQGAVPAMLPHLRPDTPVELLMICVAAYEVFCRSSSSDLSTKRLEILSPVLPYISNLLGIVNENILVLACMAFKELAITNDGVKAVKAVPGLTERIRALVVHEAVGVREAATLAIVALDAELR